MIVGIVVLVMVIYLGYLIITAENMEVMVFIRTSGKKIGIGVVQEKRYTGMYEIVSIEVSLVVLFLTLTFTRYK